MAHQKDIEAGTKMSNEQVNINPIEEQRKSALEHYRQISSAANHWNGFVEAAIEAYSPERTKEMEDGLKQYYFLYKRIGKRQTQNLWKIVDGETFELAKDEGERTTFYGDFKYEFVTMIPMT